MDQRINCSLSEEREKTRARLVRGTEEIMDLLRRGSRARDYFRLLTQWTCARLSDATEFETLKFTTTGELLSSLNPRDRRLTSQFHRNHGPDRDTSLYGVQLWGGPGAQTWGEPKAEDKGVFVMQDKTARVVTALALAQVNRPIPKWCMMKALAISASTWSNIGSTLLEETNLEEDWLWVDARYKRTRMADGKCAYTVRELLPTKSLVPRLEEQLGSSLWNILERDKIPPESNIFDMFAAPTEEASPCPT